ncbi:MAG: flavodoxin family protein [Chloroflexi bacterium]|nr:flavodoxin family protein [Chloroflexota bacterium]MCL5076166.1 flavodoxin family protein [Chloroflexota bacterium]
MPEEKRSLEPVKILGISGSPRKGATLYALNEAMRAAASLPGVETTIISLKGKKISPCLHCDYCLRHRAESFSLEKACSLKDDMRQIYEPFLEADGYILATPVYMGTVSGQLKVMMDRMRTLWFHADLLANKVGGVLVTGGDRTGGHEPAILAIVGFYMCFGILPVAGIHGGNLGAAIWSKDARAVGAAQDEEGMRLCHDLGLKVAKTARLLKQARQSAIPSA